MTSPKKEDCSFRDDGEGGGQGKRGNLNTKVLKEMLCDLVRIYADFLLFAKFDVFSFSSCMKLKDKTGITWD